MSRPEPRSYDPSWPDDKKLRIIQQHEPEAYGGIKHFIDLWCREVFVRLNETPLQRGIRLAKERIEAERFATEKAAYDARKAERERLESGGELEN